MMQHVSRIAAVLLLGVMSTIILGVPSFVLIDPPAHPAGCHSHQSPVLPATPVSYRCCVAGHQVAIPGVWFSSQFPLLYLRNASEAEQRAMASIAHCDFLILIPASASSPGRAPLRI
jgi:hypothetical protein